MFRKKVDILPAGLILLLFLVDVAVFFLAPWWVVLPVALVGLLPKFCVCAWNHHHQHVPTFHARALNRGLEVVYGLQTGVPPMGWVFHHNAGHHINYLDQDKDESRWKTRSGRTMGPLEYSVVVSLTAYPRMLANMVRATPSKRRQFLLWGAAYACIVAAAVWWNPLHAALLILLPSVAGLFLTAWHTHAHHAGLDTDDKFAASWNIVHPVYNALMGNLGYHTAHHVRCSVHWSELPAFHARIADQIPAHLYRPPLLPFVVLGHAWDAVRWAGPAAAAADAPPSSK